MNERGRNRRKSDMGLRVRAVSHGWMDSMVAHAACWLCSKLADGRLSLPLGEPLLGRRVSTVVRFESLGCLPLVCT